MQVVAKLNHLRIAPRKMRLLADLIRGEKTQKAISLLDFSLKKGSKPLKKLLEQAIANTKNNSSNGEQLEKSLLYISKITVDEGPKLKRWRARARGRSARIQKKTSHITLVLDEVKEGKKIKKIKKAQRKVQEIKEEKKPEKVEKVKKIPIFKPEKKKILRPVKEIKGTKRVFRRKAF